MGDVLEERRVLLAQRLPVVAVHVLDVEPVAVAAPDLVEDLVPLLDRDAVDHEPGGGDGLLRARAGRRRVEHDRPAAARGEDLGAVRGEVVAARAFDEASSPCGP